MSPGRRPAGCADGGRFPTVKPKGTDSLTCSLGQVRRVDGFVAFSPGLDFHSVCRDRRLPSFQSYPGSVAG
jgi:hypothetical protein